MRPSRAPSLLGPLVVLVAALGAVAFVAGLLVTGLRVDNPVTTTRVDRSSPVVVDAVYDLADLHGSTAELQVVVDIEDDTRYVPAALRGERVVYQAFGTVDGVVALSGIGPDDVTVADDGTVTVVVPRATLSEVTLDLDRSRVLARHRGLLDRAMGVFEDSPTTERDLQRAGARKLVDAAATTDLLARAEASARDLLTDLLAAGGAHRVVVRFADGAPASS